MGKKVGIDSIAYYVPQLYLDIETLAVKRDIVPAKLQKGLGLTAMAICDAGEDAATMAAEAVLRLIENENIDPRDIGRLYMGTESALDAAKPTATYVSEIVEAAMKEKYGERCMKNCDVLDMTFACVGGVDAMMNCLDYVRAGEGRRAIVVVADNAKYAL
ncbi:MAG: hydroxymethylglutaryl-CoA synthase family protein, partial [Flavobacteriales bacterium]|nr:hydroxymethylglutaryl-CoA synthase family protein [Flavobacteriales bacterium]